MKLTGVELLEKFGDEVFFRLSGRQLLHFADDSDPARLWTLCGSGKGTTLDIRGATPMPDGQYSLCDKCLAIARAKGR